jgi:hypothetical protein
LAVILGISGASECAQAAVFDTRESFVAANAISHDVTFEGIAPDAGFAFVSDPFVIGNLSISSPANSVVDQNFFVMPMDAFYVDALSGAVTFTFAKALNGVGFALSDQFNVFGMPITARIFNGDVLVRTEAFRVASLDAEDFNFSFFGVSGLGPITSIQLAPDPDVGGFLLVGEVLSSGAVPEPGSWVLMIAGFGLSGAILRRRSMATRS